PSDGNGLEEMDHIIILRQRHRLYNLSDGNGLEEMNHIIISRQRHRLYNPSDGNGLEEMDHIIISRQRHRLYNPSDGNGFLRGQGNGLYSTSEDREMDYIIRQMTGKGII